MEHLPSPLSADWRLVDSNPGERRGHGLLYVLVHFRSDVKAKITAIFIQNSAWLADINILLYTRYKKLYPQDAECPLNRPQTSLRLQYIGYVTPEGLRSLAIADDLPGSLE